MALSLIGWLNGLAVIWIIIFGCSFGFFVLYKSRKTNAKLLTYMGLAIIAGSLLYLGAFYDFLTILLTGNNMDNSNGLQGILCWMWSAPMMILFIYISVEILIPNKKKYIIPFVIVLGVIVELFIFFDPFGSLVFIYPAKNGENLIHSSVAPDSPVFLILIIGVILSLVLNGFGFLIKSFYSTGIVRKKFLLLSIGFSLYNISGFIDSTSISKGIIQIFLRIIMNTSILFWYFGLREEPEKKEKISLKKEVKVEGDLFRISQYKKEDITEEEVSISKEKKICIVCKGKVGKFMFMCPNCEAFYCDKCTHALIQSENACWVCDAPLLDSKPVKPYKQVEEEIQVETSEKPQKKPKAKK